MADAIFRIPSRAVQYGYVEVTVPGVTAETNPESLAAQYVHYVYAFQKEEQAAIERLQQNPVAAPVAAFQPVTEEQARRYLEDGLDGVTEVEENQYDRKHEVLSEGVSDAPWDKPQPAASKPWEKGSEAPAEKPVVDEGW